MHYWIDGYNLLFRISKDYQAMKGNERKLLVAINEAMHRRHFQATVVFDGREKDPPEALRKNLDALAIIYTPYNQTADDYILQNFSPNDTIVSSDRELTGKARQRGAQTLSVEQFVTRLLKKKKKPSPEKTLQETDFQLQRLLKIFEDRLNEGDS